MDHDLARCTGIDVLEQAFQDVQDDDLLVVGQRLERRELEEVRVLDLREGPAEQAVLSQLLEDVSEDLPVVIAAVVVAIGDADVAVDDLIVAVAGESRIRNDSRSRHTDLLKVGSRTTRAPLQNSLLGGRQVLPEPAGDVERLADVNPIVAVERVDDRPIAKPWIELGPRFNWLDGERSALNPEAGHTSCFGLEPSRLGTSLSFPEASS